MLPADLQAQVDAWLADDPDERDRAELTALAADDSPAAREELADRFGGRLEFGTAGLRGAVRRRAQPDEPGGGPGHHRRAGPLAAGPPPGRGAGRGGHRL